MSAGMDTSQKDESAVCDVNGYKTQGPEEIQIPVPWGFISGKLWGSRDKQPILALHGWQDNAGSFDTLAPLLSSNMPILSIDLPGHGYSSHLLQGQFYYIFWDGVVTLRRIVKHYKWNKVKLMGHSLGGAISFLYAAAYPDEVDILISLDIASPSVRDITKIATVTGDNIDKFLKYENLTLDNIPCYDYNEMINIVEEAYKGSITKEAAEILMKRGMENSYISGKYYFSRDPRLKVSMLGMLSLEMVLAYASQIKCAYLNIRAVPGMEFETPDHYHKVLDKIKENARKFEYHEVNGQFRKRGCRIEHTTLYALVIIANDSAATTWKMNMNVIRTGERRPYLSLLKLCLATKSIEYTADRKLKKFDVSVFNSSERNNSTIQLLALRDIAVFAIIFIYYYHGFSL
ncbi:hypothetical protein KPH14_005171 [Odynerus spinipes]|uniref:AB hydrolase-1 domain-containing protein n=1 Tax=Odynerus spinipes TaxID=1348599 RepID=A0AAD9VP34_9HYME|nr:hypothetical protein KPH14_005171 [Odynerus spinipes]